MNLDNSFELDLFIPNKTKNIDLSSKKQIIPNCICDNYIKKTFFEIGKNDLDCQLNEDLYEESFQKKTSVTSDTIELSENCSHYLSSKTKRDLALSQISKKEIYKQKNKESAKKCREKHKKEVIALVKQNQTLTKEITYLRRKLSLLCSNCKKIFSEVNKQQPFTLTQSTKLEIQPNINGSLLRPKTKKIAFVTSVLTIICLFSNFFMINLEKNNGNSLSKIIQVGRKLLAIEDKTVEYRLKLDKIVHDEYPNGGPYISFGDYYSLFNNKNFLKKQYEIVQTKKLRFVNDSFIVDSNITECNDCIVKINLEHIKSKNDDPLHFTIFYPLSFVKEGNNDLSFYQVECEVVGYSKNRAVP